MRQGNAATATTPTTITYHAVALTPEGKIGLQVVVRVMAGPGVRLSQSVNWTGTVYDNTPAGRKAAVADLTALNVRA